MTGSMSTPSLSRSAGLRTGLFTDTRRRTESCSGTPEVWAGVSGSRSTSAPAVTGIEAAWTLPSPGRASGRVECRSPASRRRRERRREKRRERRRGAPTPSTPPGQAAPPVAGWDGSSDGADW